MTSGRPTIEATDGPVAAVGVGTLVGRADLPMTDPTAKPADRGKLPGFRGPFGLSTIGCLTGREQDAARLGPRGREPGRPPARTEGPPEPGSSPERVPLT